MNLCFLISQNMYEDIPETDGYLAIANHLGANELNKINAIDILESLANLNSEDLAKAHIGNIYLSLLFPALQAADQRINYEINAISSALYMGDELINDLDDYLNAVNNQPETI